MLFLTKICCWISAAQRMIVLGFEMQNLRKGLFTDNQKLRNVSLACIQAIFLICVDRKKDVLSYATMLSITVLPQNSLYL